MAEQTKIVANLDKLESILKQLGGDYVCRVGILGSDAGTIHPESGITMSELGLVHEFGGTINHPGGTAYEIGEDGKARFVSNANAKEGALRTKAHKIDIPPRSFLRMPTEHKQKELVETLDTASAKEAIEKGEIKKVYKILGIAGEQIVKEAFLTSGFGQWKANAASTIRKKGSDKPLIATGALSRSITSDVIKKGEL